MQRRPRLIFTTLATLSFVLCVASTILWRKSFTHTPYVNHLSIDEAFPRSEHHWSAGFTRGQVYVFHFSSTYPSQREEGWSYGANAITPLTPRYNQGSTIWNRLGFNRVRTGWDSKYATGGSDGWLAPGRLVGLLFGLLPIARIVVAVRDHRRRRIERLPGQPVVGIKDEASTRSQQPAMESSV